jgi:hypothetical protein
MRYKGVQSKPLPQIARELGVDAVVEGTVVRSGDGVRVTAQLIESATDPHIWADAPLLGILSGIKKGCSSPFSGDHDQPRP